MVELYDLNNDNTDYLVWNFNKFFNLDENDYIFVFDYELFEIKGMSEYTEEPFDASASIIDAIFWKAKIYKTFVDFCFPKVLNYFSLANFLYSKQ